MKISLELNWFKVTSICLSSHGMMFICYVASNIVLCLTISSIMKWFCHRPWLQLLNQILLHLSGMAVNGECYGHWSSCFWVSVPKISEVFKSVTGANWLLNLLLGQGPDYEVRLFSFTFWQWHWSFPENFDILSTYDMFAHETPKGPGTKNLTLSLATLVQWRPHSIFNFPLFFCARVIDTYYVCLYVFVALPNFLGPNYYVLLFEII